MTKEFLKALGIRALRTFCQAAVAAIGTSVVLSEIDWLTVLSTAAVAAILSALTSLATGLPEADDLDLDTSDKE